jgi:hypothetical protein
MLAQEQVGSYTIQRCSAGALTSVYRAINGTRSVRLRAARERADRQAALNRYLAHTVRSGPLHRWLAAEPVSR